MGYQIIKQPDEPERFALFSSFTDTVILWDCTEDDLVEYFVKIAKEKAEQDTKQILDSVRTSRRPYAQFTMTWDEALERDKEMYGQAWRDFE